MRPIVPLVVLALLATGSAGASAAGVQAALELTLSAAPGNPADPRMGDHLTYRGTITNTGTRTVEGLVAWPSVVEIDPGQEQPIDLEDWSAHKTLVLERLAPGATVRTEWPLRLIKAGDYRMAFSVADRRDDRIAASPTVRFHVAAKPVLESTRVLTVATGVPLLLGGLVGYRRWRVG